MDKKIFHDQKHETKESSTAEASRRNFLKGSVAAAGVGLAAAAIPGLAAAATTKSQGTDATKGTTPLQDVVARPDLWFYPGEEVAPDEIRVTLMGTGWGNIIRPGQQELINRHLLNLPWTTKTSVRRFSRTKSLKTTDKSALRFDKTIAAEIAENNKRNIHEQFPLNLLADSGDNHRWISGFR